MSGCYGFSSGFICSQSLNQAVIMSYFTCPPVPPYSVRTDNADGRVLAPAVSSGAAVVLPGCNEQWLKAEAVPSGLTTAGLIGMRRVCRLHVNVCVYAALVATGSVGLEHSEPRNTRQALTGS